jgi:hypothetical protein
MRPTFFPIPEEADMATPTRESLISQAEADHAEWPQYQGHFDAYVLVRIRRKIKTKMGVAFEKGEIAIAKPKGRTEKIGGYADLTLDSRTVYSVRNKCDTAIFASDIEAVQ